MQKRRAKGRCGQRCGFCARGWCALRRCMRWPGRSNTNQRA
nr:MAG TPA: hypothetical protein [Caudoviricetes sp.]